MRQRKFLVLVVLVFSLLGGQFLAEAPVEPVIEEPASVVPAPVDLVPAEPAPTEPTLEEPTTSSTPAESTTTTSELKDYKDSFALLQNKDKKRNCLEIEQGTNFSLKLDLYNLATDPLLVKEVQLGHYVDRSKDPAEQKPFYLTPEPSNRPEPYKLKPNAIVGPVVSTAEPQNGLALDFGMFKLAEDAPSPNYLGFTVIYEDQQGRSWSQQLRYDLISKTAAATEPTTDPTTAPTDPSKPTDSTKPTDPSEIISLEFKTSASAQLYRPKERRDLSFTLSNTGNIELEITKIDLLKSGDWPLSGSTESKAMKTFIKAGQSEKLAPFEVQVLEDITPGDYALKLNVSFITPSGVEDVRSFTYPIAVLDMGQSSETTEPTVSTVPTESTEPTETTTPEESTETEPDFFSGGDWGGGGYVGGGGDWGTGETIPNPKARLLMEGFETTPKKVQAGQPFVLKVKLRNTSTDVYLRNIKFTFTADENSFLPMTGSSTVFLPKIEMDSTAEIEIEYLPQANLEQRPYALSLDMAYEDEKATELSGSEILAIPVYQEARAEIGQLEVMPEEVIVGNQVNVMFSVINKGKNKLYNVTVQKSDADQSLEIPQHFVGNIEAGSQMQVDLMATAMAPLYDSQEIVVKYEDELGNESTLKSSLDKLIINEEMIMDEPFEDPFDPEEIPFTDEPERGPLETWQYIAIGGGGLALLGGTAGVIRHRRRKKRDAIDLGLDDEI